MVFFSITTLPIFWKMEILEIFRVTANKRTKEAIFNQHAWPKRSNVKSDHSSKTENLKVTKFQKGNKYQQHRNLEFLFFFSTQIPFFKSFIWT